MEYVNAATALKNIMDSVESFRAISHELLVALKTVVANSDWADPSRDGMDGTGPVPFWIISARSAIARAEGRS
jgi:hypothetical protein